MKVDMLERMAGNPHCDPALRDKYFAEMMPLIDKITELFVDAASAETQASGSVPGAVSPSPGVGQDPQVDVRSSTTPSPPPVPSPTFVGGPGAPQGNGDTAPPATTQQAAPAAQGGPGVANTTVPFPPEPPPLHVASSDQAALPSQNSGLGDEQRRKQQADWEARVRKLREQGKGKDLPKDVAPLHQGGPSDDSGGPDGSGGGGGPGNGPGGNPGAGGVAAGGGTVTSNGGSPSFPPPPLSVHGTSGVQELIRYQIHKKRIEQFGPTVGCQACATFLGTHVPECVARFAMILGALPGSGRVVEAQAQPAAGSAPDAQANSADATWKEFIAEGAEGQRREQERIRSLDTARQGPAGSSLDGGARSSQTPGPTGAEARASPTGFKFTIPIPGYGNDDSGSGSDTDSESDDAIDVTDQFRRQRR